MLRDGTVTGLVPKGDQGRLIAVYVDGDFAFCLPKEVAADAGLRRDQHISAHQQALLLEQQQMCSAHECAVSLLSRRESSRHDIGVKLRRRGFTQAVVSETLDWLEELGFVDDHRYAAAYTREGLRAGWGRQRIVAGLMKRGVARELFTGEAWDDLRGQGDQEDGLEAVLALARRRFSGQLSADPVGAKRRLAAFLLRRGHDWAMVTRVTRLLCGEIDGEEGSGAISGD